MKMRCYVHNVPGRLRVKIPLIKYRPYTAQKAQKLLSGIDGIDNSTVNTVTGSLVVHYNPDIVQPDQLMALFEEHGYMDASQAVPNERNLPKAASKAGERLGRAVLGWAIGRILEANGMSFLAALI